jgi:UPF0755 protein
MPGWKTFPWLQNQMSRIVKMVLVVLVLAALVAGALFYDAVYSPYGKFPPEGVFVEIPRGASIRRIAVTLAEQGVVRRALTFEFLARLRGRADLKAGEYHFNRPVTADEVLARLVRGDLYYLTFTVPEGLTMFQVADRVAALRLASRDEFLLAAQNPELIRDLAPQARSLEGFLFPSTYQFARKTGAEEIVRAMVEAFRREWKTLTNPPEAPLQLNPLQVVTMASLVEKETPQAEERELVAGVYYNRLKKGVALQCDPTVLYAMELSGKNDGIIHQSDLRLDSPYNTYRHRGLPPGPIGNPGVAALRAALRPAPVDYLYFVANLEGGHSFSRTLAEHNRNVARYRRALREQAAAGAAGNGSAKRPQ